MGCAHIQAQKNYRGYVSKMTFPNEISTQKFIYEELTKTIKYKQKFMIQESAYAIYKTLFISDNIQSSAIEMEEYKSLEISLNIKTMVSKFQQFENYKQSIEDLFRLCELQKIIFNEKDVLIFQQLIGQGSQGSVEINFLKIKSQLTNQDQNDSNQVIPIATKKFEEKNQFIRESTILLKLNRNIRPIIAFIGNKQQEVNMELCMCTLGQFKNFIHGQQIQSDNLFVQLLLNLLSKVQILLSQGLFHGDIKPENIAIALRNGYADLIFIDYGASSWSKQDYLNYFTPAFCSQEIFSLIESGQILNEDQVRFAEFYSVCRTIQSLMITNQFELFKFSRIEQFIQFFKIKYPKTIQLMKLIFSNKYNCQISLLLYEDILKINYDLVNQPLQFNYQNLFYSNSVLCQL